MSSSSRSPQASNAQNLSQKVLISSRKSFSEIEKKEFQSHLSRSSGSSAIFTLFKQIIAFDNLNILVKAIHHFLNW